MTVKVKIGKAWLEDVRAEIIRIPKSVRDKLGVNVNDDIKVIGPKGSLIRTVKISPIEDVGQNIGRLDQPDRKTLGIRLGSKVKLETLDYDEDEEDEEDTYWLFSYGSNHPRQLADRIGRDHVDGRAAYVEDYKLAFVGHSRNWNGGVAAIFPEEGAEVCGYITEVTDEELDVLDSHEGVPNYYYRDDIVVQAQVDDTDEFEEIDAVVYMPGPLRQDLNGPSRRYAAAVKKTITQHWDPNECLDYLQQAIDESS